MKQHDVIHHLYIIKNRKSRRRISRSTLLNYTQSGDIKRYEDSLSISLVKGDVTLPALSNDTTSVANENHYSFADPDRYNFESKGNKDDNMPLIFVTYYPSSGQNPCYFNYNYIEIEIKLSFVWPSNFELYSSIYVEGLVYYINNVKYTVNSASDLKFRMPKGGNLYISKTFFENLNFYMYVYNDSSDKQLVNNDTAKVVLNDVTYNNLQSSQTINIKFTNSVIYIIPLYDTNSDYDSWLNTNIPYDETALTQCYSTDANRKTGYTINTNDSLYGYGTMMFHHVYKDHRIGCFMGCAAVPSLKIPTKLINYNAVKNIYSSKPIKRNTNDGVMWGAAQNIMTTNSKYKNSSTETLNSGSKVGVNVIYNWPNYFPAKFMSGDLYDYIYNTGWKDIYGDGFTQHQQVCINEMFVDSNYDDTSINYAYRKVGTVHHVSSWKGNSVIICDNSATNNSSFKKNMPYNGILLGMKEYYNDTIVSAGNISFGGINAIYTGSYMTLHQTGKIGHDNYTFLQWINPNNSDSNNFAGYWMIGRVYRKGYFLTSIGARLAVYPNICKTDVLNNWNTWMFPSNKLC